jgi:hypothetical protein
MPSVHLGLKRALRRHKTNPLGKEPVLISRHSPHAGLLGIQRVIKFFSSFVETLREKEADKT